MKMSQVSEKKHKCKSMSEHLQDPENTSDPRGLRITITLLRSS